MILNQEDLNFFDDLDDSIAILKKNSEIIYSNKSFKNFYDELIKKNTFNDYSEFDKALSRKIEKCLLDEDINQKKLNSIKRLRLNDDVDIYLNKIKFDNTDSILLRLKMIEQNSYENSCEDKKSIIDKNQILRKTLIYSPNILIIKKDRKIVFLNKSAEQLLEIGNSQEVIGKDFYEVLNFKTKKRSYYSDILENEGHYYSTLPVSQVKLKTYKGREIYADICFMSFFDSDEEFSVFIAKDISTRVEMEEALRKNEEYYKKLIKFLPYGVGILTKGKITFANDNLVNILGETSINALIGKKINDSIKDKDTINEMNRIGENSLSEVKFREVTLTRKDGKEIEIEIGASPFLFENHLSSIIVLCDITERKNAERDKFKLKQALKYDKLKTEFIANISHELKTPLNIILSVVQLLELKEKEECSIGDSKRYLGVMTQNCYRLLRLINNLIDISRIDVGYLKMDFGNYDIVKIIEDITLSTVDYIESKNLNLIFDTEIEEKTIGVDRENMERIMLNLLSNAIKCSKENGTIWVNIYDNGDFIDISVKDNGIGIPEDMQEKIFERFVQSTPLFTRPHEGSGIGLSLVKSLVDAHGGKISVKSKVGEGSEFTISMPNRLSKKDNPHINYKFIGTNKNSNVEKIKIEFSDIYN